jgi:hypothetical protein
MNTRTPAQTKAGWRLPGDISEAMQALKNRDGVPLNEQIRRALRSWLHERGVLNVARGGKEK